MKKILLLTFLLFFSCFLFAQVNWTFSAKKIDGKKYELHMVASVSSPWHIYSQTTHSGGPLPTILTMDNNPMLSLEGNAKEVGQLVTKHEKVFGVDVKYFNNSMELVQVIVLKAKVKTMVSGNVEYMVCNDAQCLPPKKISFSIPLK